jgi:hypothetical protein
MSRANAGIDNSYTSSSTAHRWLSSSCGSTSAPFHLEKKPQLICCETENPKFIMRDQGKKSEKD